MRITKRDLSRIIAEEVQKELQEQGIDEGLWDKIKGGVKSVLGTKVGGSDAASRATVKLGAQKTTTDITSAPARKAIAQDTSSKNIQAVSAAFDKAPGLSNAIRANIKTKDDVIGFLRAVVLPQLSANAGKYTGVALKALSPGGTAPYEAGITSDEDVEARGKGSRPQTGTAKDAGADVKWSDSPDSASWIEAPKGGKKEKRILNPEKRKAHRAARAAKRGGPVSGKEEVPEPEEEATAALTSDPRQRGRDPRLAGMDSAAKRATAAAARKKTRPPPPPRKKPPSTQPKKGATQSARWSTATAEKGYFGDQTRKKVAESRVRKRIRTKKRK